jgi:hypothetical protein
MEKSKTWETGAWVGRQQAFAVVASHSSAARALCLKHIKESRAYESLGIKWDRFCREHAGISRAHADRLIQQYKEFGEAYLKLSQMIRISPELFRKIAPQVHDEVLEFDGEKIPLIPENAPRIRAAIRELRSRLSEPRPSITVKEFQNRIDAIAVEITSLAYMSQSAADLDQIRGIIAYGQQRWNRAASDAAAVKRPAAPELR